MPVFGLGGGGGDKYLPVTKRAKTGSCLCLGWGGRGDRYLLVTKRAKTGSCLCLGWSGGGGGAEGGTINIYP